MKKNPFFSSDQPSQALPGGDATPVAPLSSPLKLWAFRAAAVLVGVYILVSLYRGSESKQVAAPAPAAPTVTEQAPTLPLSEQQVKRLKTAMRQLQNMNNEQNSEQMQRLEKMRQVAQVEAYSAESMSAAASTTAKTGNPNAVLGGDGTGDGNTQLLSRISQSDTPIANATHIAHPATTILQGTLIWATLETRVASDLPGMVRAVTSDDIYAEDGSQILLPKGSRLIGQYNNGIAQGQSRVFVVWQRAIRPDHIDIQLASPGTDPLGTAGIGADSIDHHFWQQFGTAALLSIIDTGAANMGVSAGNQYNSAAAYRMGLANSFSQTAQNTLQSTGVIPPTLTVNQGDKISVFVARDLDFYSELKRLSTNDNF